LSVFHKLFFSRQLVGREEPIYGVKIVLQNCRPPEADKCRRLLNEKQTSRLHPGKRTEDGRWMTEDRSSEDGRWKTDDGGWGEESIYYFRFRIFYLDTKYATGKASGFELKCF